MLDHSTLRRAVNSAGYEVQRLTASGWTAVTGQPLGTWELADAYLACCDPAEGEFRVYEALRGPQKISHRFP